MNYLVDLQTSKAKHCTARCRGNPSGTFPIPVWGWRGFQTGSGGVAEQTWPEGSGPASVRLLFPPAAKSLPPARAARGFGLAWGLLATAPAGRAADPTPHSRTRVGSGAPRDMNTVGSCLPSPLPHPPLLLPTWPSRLSRWQSSGLRQEWGGKGGGQTIKKRQTFESVFIAIRAPRAFLFLPEFFSQPRAEISGHFKQLQI